MKSFEELFPSNSDKSNHASPIVNECKMHKRINKIKSKVHELLLDSKWQSDTWKFADYNNFMNSNLKKRDFTETDADLAVELHILFIIWLENLVEKG